ASSRPAPSPASRRSLPSTSPTMTERAGGPATRHSSRAPTPDQQFWQLWRQGQRPDLAAFLAGRPGLSPADVAGVIAIDQFERWLAGDRVPAEQYLALLPAGPEHDQAACDVIYGEYLLREQLGEHPDPDDYRRRFPAHAESLSRQLELHGALSTGKEEPPSHASPQA